MHTEFCDVLECCTALRKGLRVVHEFFFGILKEKELNEGCKNRKGRKKASSLGTNALVLSNFGRVLRVSF